MIHSFGVVLFFKNPIGTLVASEIGLGSWDLIHLKRCDPRGVFADTVEGRENYYQRAALEESKNKRRWMSKEGVHLAQLDLPLSRVRRSMGRKGPNIEYSAHACCVML